MTKMQYHYEYVIKSVKKGLYYDHYRESFTPFSVTVLRKALADMVLLEAELLGRDTSCVIKRIRVQDR